MGLKHKDNPLESCKKKKKKEFPNGVNKAPLWVESTSVLQWVMKEKKKISLVNYTPSKTSS